jgi:hypothetical protein
MSSVSTPFLAPLPHSNRNTVFTALFNYMQLIAPPTGQQWKSFSQFLRHWNEVNTQDQPAMFLHRGPQTASQTSAFGVTKWRWTATIWIYYRTDSYRTNNHYPDEVTDPLIDSIEQLFQTDPLTGRLTLGGLVHHCYIDGTIFADSGMTDDPQAVILIPITILL